MRNYQRVNHQRLLEIGLCDGSLVQSGVVCGCKRSRSARRRLMSRLELQYITRQLTWAMSPFNLVCVALVSSVGQ